MSATLRRGSSGYGATIMYTGGAESVQRMLVNRVNGGVSPTRWTYGTGAYQFTKLLEATLTLFADAAQSLDLSGALIDPFAASFVLTKAKLIWVWNPATVAGDKGTVFGNIFGAWQDQDETLANEDVHPQASFIKESPVDGFTVTNGTQDTLSVKNNGANTIAFRVLILGI